MSRTVSFPVRLAIGIIALGYMGVAAFNALDRSTDKWRDLADKVPSAFATTSHTSLARQAIIDKRWDEAARQSRIAIEKAPLDSQAVAFLGLAAAQTNAPDVAEKAMLLSSRLGWREPSTQIYMMSRAFSTGDYDGGMQHYDALLRQNPANHRNMQITMFTDGNVNAQPALLRLLGRRPPWLDAYATDVDDMSAEQLSLRAAILADMPDKGIRLGCDGIDKMVHELGRHGAFDDAHLLWTMHCAKNDSGLIWDGHLAQLGNNQSGLSEFRWQTMPSGDLDVRTRPVASGGQGNWLDVVNHGEFPLPFLRQMTVLEPGEYILRWDARGADGKPIGAVTVNASCGTLTPLPIQPNGQSAARLSVTAACSPEWFEFHIQPHDQVVSVGSISLFPAADH